MMKTINEPVSVEARFDEEGTVTPTGETFELCLDTSTLQWQIVRAWERPKMV